MSASPIHVAIVCDRDPGFALHQRTEDAIGHAAVALGVSARIRWVDTRSLDEPADVLADAHAVWVGPGQASPHPSFRDPHGVYRAIRHARLRGIPFLGTCAGFQHAAIEIVNHAMHGRADHPEYGVASAEVVLRRHACPPAPGASVWIRIASGSLAARVYAVKETDEPTTCSFGVDPAAHQRLLDAGVRISAVDPVDSDVRIIEIPGHPFFVATSFVPQLRSSSVAPHPLVPAWLQAAARARGQPFPCLEFREARAEDLAPLVQLLTAADLVVDDVGDHVGEATLAISEGAMVGVAIVERHGESGLLRSVAVTPALRGVGIANAVCAEALRRADGIRRAYLLTTSAVGYFTRFGFHEVGRDEAPAEIRASREFRELCPRTAVLMMRSA